jgi:hypothetical protein
MINEEEIKKHFLMDVIIFSAIILSLPFILYFISQIPFYFGSFLSRGTGQYTGTVVETRNHGILFRTYAVQLKTGGFTQKFEDFCVTDKEVYDKLSALPRNKEITVNYKSKLSTPSWDCDFEDSSDIITSFKIEE